MVMVSEDEKFNPASATREIFTQAINRALNDMTDAQIEALVQSAVGTEMSQRQMADLNLQSALETAVSAIRSEMTQKASTSDVTAAVADEAAARQAADAELHNAVGAVAALGAKNLLKITASSQTIKGVTFTVNDDQTVTVNGTNDGTGASTFVIVPNAQAITIPDGNYILSGCPTGGGESVPFDLRWYMYSPGKSAYDSGNGASIEKSGNGTGSNIAIVVKTGQTAHNITFKPMIRRAEITDSTYVPYAPTNRELYELCETKASLNDIYGIKNQLPNGTDLNNLSAGIMMCPGATVAATLINCPTTTDAFIIYTDYLATTSRAIQRIYSFSTTTGIPAQYMRVRWSQGWTPWYQVMMQSVASAQSAASLMQAGRLDAELTDAQEVTDDA